MPAAKLTKINLIPKDAFEFSTLGRVMKWALTTGRVLVVLTEFVVILAFGSRFYFDQKLNDLLDSNEQKQAVVESFSEIESKARNVFARQQIVENYLGQNLQINNRISQIQKITPADVSFYDIAFTKSGVNFSGTSGSEVGLANFLVGVNNLPNVEGINIGVVDFDQRQGVINFRVIANTKI